MSKETAFYPRLEALTDEWMDLWMLTDDELVPLMSENPARHG